ncbi:hypothetical protein [Streptomyces sp. NBC_01233]|uniref:hypothetical protein n=1 Tax=Streptomyces sp. NBC_01233 TaxID=2903787 RepID=UPI002E108D35|nr:hypothetical protein OG332_45745 [Streptomyces sp. NBC_01233]
MEPLEALSAGLTLEAPVPLGPRLTLEPLEPLSPGFALETPVALSPRVTLETLAALRSSRTRFALRASALVVLAAFAVGVRRTLDHRRAAGVEVDAEGTVRARHRVVAFPTGLLDGDSQSIRRRGEGDE